MVELIIKASTPEEIADTVLMLGANVEIETGVEVEFDEDESDSSDEKCDCLFCRAIKRATSDQPQKDRQNNIPQFDSRQAYFDYINSMTADLKPIAKESDPNPSGCDSPKPTLVKIASSKAYDALMTLISEFNK